MDPPSFTDLPGCSAPRTRKSRWHSSPESLGCLLQRRVSAPCQGALTAFTPTAAAGGTGHACFKAEGRLLAHPDPEENWKSADRFTRGLGGLALPGAEGMELQWRGGPQLGRSHPRPAAVSSPGESLQQLIWPRPSGAPGETHRAALSLSSERPHQAPGRGSCWAQLRDSTAPGQVRVRTASGQVRTGLPLYRWGQDRLCTGEGQDHLWTCEGQDRLWTGGDESAQRRVSSSPAPRLDFSRSRHHLEALGNRAPGLQMWVLELGWHGAESSAAGAGSPLPSLITSCGSWAVSSRSQVGSHVLPGGAP